MSEPPEKEPVTLLNADISQMSKVEQLKAGSEGLFYVASKDPHTFRSEIDAMIAGDAETISNEAKEISKHFGIYKQQARVGGRKSKDFIFMLRLRVPAGGEFSAAQWAALCEASDRFADGSLRLTTRQAIQFHWVRGKNLGPLVRFLGADYPNTGYEISTLAACGDVNRNTMCAVVDDLVARAPMKSRELAYEIAMELAPRSSAYYQIFLTDENRQTPMSSEEPIYGTQYLPRKFKVGIGHPDDNSVDLLTQDVGLLPVSADGDNFDLYVGGGLGTTYGQPRTRALLGVYLGRIPREQVVSAVRAVAVLQRENGERKDRRLARLKYTLRRMGSDVFKAALRERFEIRLEDAEPVAVPPNRFWHGWHDETGGKKFLGIAVPSGRVKDGAGARKRAAISAVLEAFPDVGVRLTGNQDLVLTHIPADSIPRVDTILAEHGVAKTDDVSRFRRQAFGCPALPTCGLAMTEAEAAMPDLSRAVEAAGLGEVDVVVRMAGCPNHCSRPPSAEIGITGFGKNAHLVAVGGSREGTRIARTLYEKVSSEQLPDIVIGLLRAIRDHNPGNLPAGEFLHRTDGDALRALVGVEA